MMITYQVLGRESWAKQPDLPGIVGKQGFYGTWVPLHTDSEDGSRCPQRIWKLDFHMYRTFLLKIIRLLFLLFESATPDPAVLQTSAWVLLGEKTPTLCTPSPADPLGNQLPLPNTAVQRLKNNPYVPWVFSFLRQTSPALTSKVHRPVLWAFSVSLEAGPTPLDPHRVPPVGSWGDQWLILLRDFGVGLGDFSKGGMDSYRTRISSHFPGRH